MDKRKYYRIFTDLNYQIGENSKEFYEKVNISAGGVAFIMSPELEKNSF